MDTDIRELERRVAGGDGMAEAFLLRAKLRTGHVVRASASGPVTLSGPAVTAGAVNRLQWARHELHNNAFPFWSFETWQECCALCDMGSGVCTCDPRCIDCDHAITGGYLFDIPNIGPVHESCFWHTVTWQSYRAIVG